MMSTETDQRLAEVVEAVTASLRDVIKVHHITNEEWHAALAFLTEVGRRTSSSCSPT